VNHWRSQIRPQGAAIFNRRLCFGGDFKSPFLELLIFATQRGPSLKTKGVVILSAAKDL
jgi:hypothetical protein